MPKDIIFFDLETTGTDTVKDRICQIAAVKVNHDFSMFQAVKKYLINPTINIPTEATEVHGITNEMVKDAPTFKQFAKGAEQYFNGCDLAGFNILQFDVPLLSEEFNRVGIKWPDPKTKVADAFHIFREKEKRDLAAAVKFYCGKDHTDAHDAGADVLATVDVLTSQIKKYEELAPDMQTLHSFCEGENKRIDLAGKLVMNKDGEAIYNFGRHKGHLVKSQPGFAKWMLSADGMPSNTIQMLKMVMGWL